MAVTGKGRWPLFVVNSIGGSNVNQAKGVTQLSVTSSNIIKSNVAELAASACMNDWFFPAAIIPPITGGVRTLTLTGAGM